MTRISSAAVKVLIEINEVEDDERCKSWDRNQEDIIRLLEELKSKGFVNYTEPISGVKSDIVTACIEEKGIKYLNDRDNFLKKLYEMKEAGNPNNCKKVVDCLEGAEYEIIQELAEEGYIEPACLKIDRGIDVSKVITEKGFQYLVEKGMI